MFYDCRNWTGAGVNTTVADNSTVQCTTTHLTSFAVLVSVQRGPMEERVSAPLVIVPHMWVKVDTVYNNTTLKWAKVATV